MLRSGSAQYSASPSVYNYIYGSIASEHNKLPVTCANREATAPLQHGRGATNAHNKIANRVGRFKAQ